MKTATVITALCLLSFACHRGVWVSDNTYRPRKPDFSILKEKFQANKLINSDFVYVSTRRYVNYDGAKLYDYTGLYQDGRMIGFDVKNNEASKDYRINTWETAPVIGYYTTYGNRIRIQYFVSANGGQYLEKEGIIRQDTIIVHEVSNKLFGRNVKYDTLVVSSNPLE